MALITVETLDGPQQIRVCDYCRTVCIPSGRYCSGRCAGRDWERLEQMRQMATTILEKVEGE